MGLEEVPHPTISDEPSLTDPDHPNYLDYSHIAPSEARYSLRKRLFRPLDRYFRSEETVLARFLKYLSPQQGTEYLDSMARKSFRLLTLFPAIVVFPAVYLIMIANKLEDPEHSVFYLQQRVAPGWEPNGEIAKGLIICKIRTMKIDAELDYAGLQAAQGLPAWQDPRNTAVGGLVRRFNIDELPQIYQILLGQLDAVGIRPATTYDFQFLQAVWSEIRYLTWEEDYRLWGRGLTGERQTMGTNTKNLFIRYHPDHHYAQRAHLGLDLYLIWRTLGRAVGIL